MERVIGPSDSSVAFGAPGIEPTWQRGDKDGVGTSYSSSSQLWFTIWHGIVTEVYSPTVDHPQIRDLQVIFFDDQGNVLPETAMKTHIETMDESLGYRVWGSSENEPRFTFEKEIISDPHRSCLLLHFKVAAEPEVLQRLHACVLCAPRLASSGRGNNGQSINFLGRQVLVAEHKGEWLALAAHGRFSRTSVGYVGSSDAWTDLEQHKRLSWTFASAPDGNIALAGQIDLAEHSEFTLLLSFGQSQHSALASTLQSAALPYEQTRKRFLDQWARLHERFEDLAPFSGDGGALYRTSLRLLLAHEDKIYPGALVASLANPWGEVHGDEDGEGGYHLIWTRDLVQSALGLLAGGQTETPLRAFLYLAASQDESGKFPQNFWVNGVPHWQGIQLDEIAFPLILAHRLWKSGAISLDFLEETALRAISYLLLAGPITEQERWEESAGLSPSTLAVLITAMICASEMAEQAGDLPEQRVVEEYADWLESQLEDWTVTRSGRLLDGVPEHYVRINPLRPGETPKPVSEMHITLNNIPPDRERAFPASDIVDAGFLELVRYGVRRPDDPIVLNSLKVVDHLLRVETPCGVVWRRYNHDGYGQQSDGSSYVTFGQGRGWPLLVGERGHYAIAACGDAHDYIRWMERFATPTQLLPEQSWDEEATSDGRQQPGRPTGSAVPLLWAHAEYVKLLRSQRDGRAFDLNDRVAQRYGQENRAKCNVFFWSFACPIPSAAAGNTLRIVAEQDFDLLFSCDDWACSDQRSSGRTKIRLAFLDVHVPEQVGTSLTFTFYWKGADRWEGKNFTVTAS